MENEIDSGLLLGTGCGRVGFMGKNRPEGRVRVRVKLVGPIIKRPLWAVGLIYGLLGGYDLVKSQLIPESWADRLPRAIEALPSWSPWTYSTITLGVLLMWILEGTYRHLKSIRTEEFHEHPIVSVTPYLGPDDKTGAEAGYLRVHNAGASCEIDAAAEIIGGKLSNDRLRDAQPIPWRYLRKGQTQIVRNGKDAILGIEARLLEHPNVDYGFEYLLQFERIGGDWVDHVCAEWSPTHSSPDCIVRIRLGTDPATAGEALSFDYVVGIYDDGKAIWKPVSVSNARDPLR